MVDEGTASTSIENDTEDTKKTVFVVGEHSVYNSVEDLFEGAKQKEAYIAQLIKANKELQERYDSLEHTNNLVKELQEFRKDITEKGVDNMDNTNTTVDYDTMKEIALKAMQEQTEAQKAENNLNECLSAVSKLGEDVELALKNKAGELGVGVEYLKDIAKTSPKAFKSLFGLKQSDAIAPNFLQSTKQVSNESGNEAEEFFKNKQLSSSPRAIAAFMEKAMKDPSILDNVKW